MCTYRSKPVRLPLDGRNIQCECPERCNSMSVCRTSKSSTVPVAAGSRFTFFSSKSARPVYATITKDDFPESTCRRCRDLLEPQYIWLYFEASTGSGVRQYLSAERRRTGRSRGCCIWPREHRTWLRSEDDAFDNDSIVRKYSLKSWPGKLQDPHI